MFDITCKEMRDLVTLTKNNPNHIDYTNHCNKIKQLIQSAAFRGQTKLIYYFPFSIAPEVVDTIVKEIIAAGFSIKMNGKELEVSWEEAYVD